MDYPQVGSTLQALHGNTKIRGPWLRLHGVLVGKNDDPQTGWINRQGAVFKLTKSNNYQGCRKMFC